MSRLLSLLKATMSQDMNLFKMKTKNKSKINKMVLPVFLVLVLMFSIGSYAQMLAESLAKVNLTYIILTLFVMATSLLALIEGVYKSQGILFDAKDNDLLFSLPITKSKIFFTRVFKMISFQLLYNSLFMIPAIIVYAMYERPSTYFYILSIIMLLLLPIIPTIVGCIIGYIIKAVTSKIKTRNLVQVILTSLILLFVFYISFNMQSMIENIVQNANSINEVITKVYYPAGLYINLIQNFNISDFITLLAINIIPAVLFVYIASIFYFNVISKLSEKGIGRKKIKKGVNKIFKVKKPLQALIVKEIKRFFSSPVFIINAGFGMVLMIAFTACISINFDGIIGSMLKLNELPISINEIKEILPKIFYCFVIFVSCMTSITSSMISLEGKSFNITKSLPILEDKVILAKVLTSNIISVPVIIVCDIVFFIVFKVRILDIIFILLASIIVPTFTAIIGIIMNLKYPKMDASSDTEVVKQSMSSMFSVFIGMFSAMSAIGIVIAGSNINIDLFIILELLVFSIVCLILWKYLKKYGARRFKDINI